MKGRSFLSPLTLSGSVRSEMTLFDLSGRVAVVTGGNGGIGLGMARGLASPGPRSLWRRATR